MLLCAIWITDFGIEITAVNTVYITTVNYNSEDLPIETYKSKT